MDRTRPTPPPRTGLLPRWPPQLPCIRPSLIAWRLWRRMNATLPLNGGVAVAGERLRQHAAVGVAGYAHDDGKYDGAFDEAVAVQRLPWPVRPDGRCE